MREAKYIVQHYWHGSKFRARKGAGGFITPDTGQGRVIGVYRTYGPGINPLNFIGIPALWNVNINYGGTETFKKK